MFGFFWERTDYDTKDLWTINDNMTDVIGTEKCPYDSRNVNYDRKVFIRLATCPTDDVINDTYTPLPCQLNLSEF